MDTNIVLWYRAADLKSKNIYSIMVDAMDRMRSVVLPAFTLPDEDGVAIVKFAIIVNLR